MQQGVHTSDSAAKKYFIALETEVDKLDIAKLVIVSTSLNNSKNKSKCDCNWT